MDNQKKYFKITNATENHNGFQYHDGLNILTEPFVENGSCVAGGLYFTDVEHIFHFVSYGVYLREIILPIADSDFKCVADKNDKWRANKLIFGLRYNLYDISTFQYLIQLGANYLLGEYNLLQWAAYKGHYAIVEYLISLPGLKDNKWAYKYAIWAACKDNYFNIIRLLINVGANIRKNHEPLRKAVMVGDLTMVVFLVENGAKVYANKNHAVR